MAITWTSFYDTNIKEVDDQHRKLIEMINDLENSRGEDNEPKLIREIFFKLVDYTKYHFGQEEVLMSNSKYPKFNEHIAQHREFVKKIVSMLEAMKEGKLKISEDLNMFLMNWLINHILGYDKEFAAFYKNVSR